jgi:hypothetical protein
MIFRSNSAFLEKEKPPVLLGAEKNRDSFLKTVPHVLLHIFRKQQLFFLPRDAGQHL